MNPLENDGLVAVMSTPDGSGMWPEEWLDSSPDPEVAGSSLVGDSFNSNRGRGLFPLCKGQGSSALVSCQACGGLFVALSISMAADVIVTDCFSADSDVIKTCTLIFVCLF